MQEILKKFDGQRYSAADIEWYTGVPQAFIGDALKSQVCFCLPAGGQAVREFSFMQMAEAALIYQLNGQGFALPALWRVCMLVRPYYFQVERFYLGADGRLSDDGTGHQVDAGAVLRQVAQAVERRGPRQPKYLEPLIAYINKVPWLTVKEARARDQVDCVWLHDGQLWICIANLMADQGITDTDQRGVVVDLNGLLGAKFQFAVNKKYFRVRAVNLERLRDRIIFKNGSDIG